MTQENSEQTPKELREAYDALKKDHEAMSNQFREFRAETVASQVGFTPEQTKLWLTVADEGSLTADAAKQFAEAYGLQVQAEPPAAEGTQTDTTPPGQPKVVASTEGSPEGVVGGNADGAALASMGSMTGAGGVVPPGQPQPGQKMPFGEWQQLLRTDNARAMELYTQGGVDRPDGNVLADRLTQRGEL